MYDLDRVTRRVKVEIGGRTYALAFSLSGLQELEKYLGNLNTFFSEGKVPSITNLSIAFWIALKGGGQNIERKDSEPIISAFCREYGLEKLTEIFFVVFAASGFLGKEASNKLLEQFGITDTKAPETKNAKKAGQK